jgi:hypothetical protein
MGMNSKGSRENCREKAMNLVVSLRGQDGSVLVT